MDMKEQTRNSVLTAMVCVALSSGTAWAAVPEVQVPAVQQSAGTGAASLAEASVADVVAKEKAKKKAGENFSSVQPQTQENKVQEQKQRMNPPREDPSVTAAKLHSMPLYWSALKPKEEQVQKAQPIIITAEDIEAQRKAEKRAAAAQAAIGAQKKSEMENTPRQQAAQTVAANTAAPKPAAVAGVPAQVPQPAQQHAAQTPRTENVPVVKPPAPAAAPAPVKPADAVPGSQAQTRVPAATGSTGPAAQSEYRPPQPQAAEVPRQESPRQEAPVPAVRQEPRRMVQLHPEGLYASRRQRPVADAPGAQEQQPAYREEKRDLSPQQAVQPTAPVQQPLPKQIEVERPPEYEGISDEVVRHIMAGEFAMRYQLSKDATEPGVYRLTQILVKNEGLSHLQKIEYLMGFGRAINNSNLSEYRKKALIDAVIQSFDDK